MGGGSVQINASQNNKSKQQNLQRHNPYKLTLFQTDIFLIFVE